MDPALKKGFGEKYGVEVKEVNFDNLEAMVIKLRSGASYDLIWPSTEYVDRLNAEGLLARFDRGLLRNNDNISSFYDSPWWDPENELSVPYTYYTTGIAWREDEVSGMTGSWNDLLNPDGEGRMFILDDFQEAIGEANLINGFDLNTPDPAELEISKQTLLDQKENARGFLHQLRAEPGLRHRRAAPGLERRHRQRPQPGRRARALPVRDLLGGRARRHRPDGDPDHLEEPGHRDAVHGLDHRPRERGPERELERLSATGRGRQAGVRRAGQGGALDRRRPRGARGLALEYRLDDPDARRLWTDIFTEVKAG